MTVAWQRNGGGGGGGESFAAAAAAWRQRRQYGGGGGIAFSLTKSNYFGIVSVAFGFVCTAAATVDVSTGAAVADDDAVSTVVPPSSTKDEGAYVGVSVAFEGVCVGGRRCFVDCCLLPPHPMLYPLPPPPGRHCC